jgi:hypothetical protein
MAFGLATSHYCESTPNPRQATAASWVQDDDDEPRAHNNRHARMTLGLRLVQTGRSKLQCIPRIPLCVWTLQIGFFRRAAYTWPDACCVLFLRLDELATEDCVTWLNDGFAQTAWENR